MLHTAVETSPANTASPLESSPALQGERLSFTGTLASMTHRQAMDLAEQHGGATTHSVSKQTSMLVVGEEGWVIRSSPRDSNPVANH